MSRFSTGGGVCRARIEPSQHKTEDPRFRSPSGYTDPATLRSFSLALVLFFSAATAQAKPVRSRPVQHARVPSKQVSPSRSALPPYLQFPTDIESTAAYRYAQLSRSACEAELQRRKIRSKPQGALGVLAPRRLIGPLNGVFFRGEGTDEAREKSVHEIADCRLILAMFDMAAILTRHDIVEVRHFSMYRLPPPSWPRSRVADRHLGALALDAGRFIKRDGSILDVDRHFHGAIGAKTCGAGAAPRPATPQAVELRAVLCEIVAERLFSVVLTPNYNEPHKNHFHLEVTAGKRWLLIH